MKNGFVIEDEVVREPDGYKYPSDEHVRVVESPDAHKLGEALLEAFADRRD